MYINKFLSVPSSKLETWLGNETVENISRAMRGYHADIAIPVGNIPDSRVFVTRDGDFVGSMKGGHYNSLWNLMQDRAKRSVRKTLLHTGFSSLSDLISELTSGGKRQRIVNAWRKLMKGWKTITGTIGFALCEGIKILWPEYKGIAEAIQIGVFAPLGVYGIAHKIEKSGEVK